jgi:hypothetical protein
MGLADLLSTPFLISLGITFLLVGILGIFLSQKIMDQNHKISSMLGLVTTMAEELNFIRSRFQMNNFSQGGALVEPVKREVENLISKEEPLIDVSDDDDDDDDEDEDEDEESEEDEEGDEEEEEEEEEEGEKLVIGEESQHLSTIKVIQMGESMTFKEQEEEEKEDEVEDDLEELEEVDESTFVTEEEDVSSYAEESVVEEKPLISGANLKKMTIQTLRDIAVKKGFSGDVSKMKKADVLKIVEGFL